MSSLLIPTILSLFIGGIYSCSLEPKTETSEETGNRQTLDADNSGDSSFSLTTPEIDDKEVKYIKIKLQLLEEPKTVIEKEVEYVGRKTILFPKLQPGKWHITMWLLNGKKEELLKGEGDVTIEDGKVAFFDMELSDSENNLGSLAIRIKRRHHHKIDNDNFACKMSGSDRAFPMLCEQGKFSCEVKIKDKVYKGESGCGVVFAKHKIYKQICEDKVPFSQKDSKEISCSISGSWPDKEVVNACDATRKWGVCIELFMPTKCFTSVKTLLGDEKQFSAGGLNTCLARNNLFKDICSDDSVTKEVTVKNVKCGR